MKNIIIFFDFEGKYGMPHNSGYDLAQTTSRLLDVLSKYKVKAVFFVVGKIIEEDPELIKEISIRGHEIAIHGYAHEHLDKFTQKDLVKFNNNLYQTENTLEKLTGKRPVGFRSPYVMAPKFYTPELYKILEEHGYKWVSNRELRYPEELFRPDRLSLPILWGKNNWFTQSLFVLLNIRLLLTEAIKDKSGFSRVATNLQWFAKGNEPFMRKNLVEIPLYSPFDCDLLGLPKPDMVTTNEWIDYTSTCLAGGISRPGNLYALNFHDWIIGSSNRISIFENVLKILKFDKNNNFIKVTELVNEINLKSYE